MRKKNYKLLAGTLVVALIMGSLPTNVSADTKSVNKIVTSKNKTTTVVKTVSELKNALKNKSIKKVELKTDKKVKFNLSGNNKGVKLVINAPKAEIKNTGKFKSIEVNAKLWVEKASGNKLVVKAKNAGIEVAKNVKVAEVKLDKSDAKVSLKVNGELRNLTVNKKTDIKLSGKTGIVFMSVNAEGTKVESSIQIDITANKNVEAILSKGAEGSSVKVTDDKVAVNIKNDTKDLVFVENAAGKQTILAVGTNKEIKNGIIADKGNTSDENISVDEDKNTPLGEANTGETNTTPAVTTPVVPAGTGGGSSAPAENNEKYAPIEDKLLLKVINKNIDKNRADDQRVTKEEMAKLTELSIFLGDDGKPKFSQTEFLNGGNISDEDEPTDSILGKPRSLKGTSDFKFAVSRGIKSIKGLEYAVNLEKLKLNENEIKDISPLAGLAKLKYIEIQRNRIVDVTPLSGLTELVYLKLYNNLIEDVTPLAGLTKLKGLDLHYNVTVGGDENHKIISKGITDISTVIDNMKELMFLDVSANRINSIKGLETLNKIKNLDLSGNNISDYTGLGNYIAERQKHVSNEEPGWSLNFSGQTVPFNKEVIVTGNEAELDNPFMGIDELSASLGRSFGDEDIHLFSEVIADGYTDNITMGFDKKTNKIKLKVSDKLINENKAEGLTVSFTIKDILEMAWKIKNVKLKFVDKPVPQLEANGKVYRKYDLREQKAVTKIKNQFRDGGCRSFAALGALESHIKLKTGTELDLSENNFENRHGFYFGTSNVRSGRNRNSDLPYLVNYGPILESDDPYIPMKGDGGENNYLTQEQVNEAAKNPVIKDGVKQIMGFEFLKTVDTAKVSTSEDDELLQIKEAIAKNGGVVADMYMAHDGRKTFPYTDEKYYNVDTKAYYFDGNDSERASKYNPIEIDGIKYGANHAITIVGWDDDFSKDNFAAKPEIDGAWIVRDAQSEAFGDKGYFYVSFKSVSMGENPYVFTDVIDYQYGIYQHDELAFTGYREGISFATDVKDVLFNRYKAEADSKIEKVGFYTTKKNAEYEVYLVPNFSELEEKAEEIGGEEAEEFYKMIQEYKVLEGRAEKAGYHTINIPVDKIANITKGKDFALGIWTKNSDAEDPKHKYDMVIEKKDNMGQGKNAKIQKKQTYYYDKDEGFMDLNQYLLETNACIKAYYRK